jgi:Alanine dehydrogenase
MIEPMFSSLTAESRYPQEKLEISHVSRNPLQIGMPKENRVFEKRLALTPEAVAILVAHGHHVIVETGAGETIQYSDHDYSEAGAEIANHERVWACEVVIKIASPVVEEVALMRPNSILLSFLQLKLLSSECLNCIAEKHIYAIAYDFITDDLGNLPIKNQIREIEGRAAVMIAANLLTSELGGKGILLGSCAGVSPTEVVIIGASRDGIEAARAAKALGALVKVFDNRIEALRNLQRQLGCDTFTSTMHPNVLRNSLRTADVVIGTWRVEKDEKPSLITSDLIMTMKKRSAHY